MNHILYADFLENKRVYNLAQGAWKRLLNKVLKDFGYTYTPYLNELQNGKKEYDGNPIFNAYIPEIKRAIRIIQVSPKEEGDDISAWVDDIALSQSKHTKELVLDLKLSKKVKKIAEKLIGEWINQQLDDATVNNLLSENVN